MRWLRFVNGFVVDRRDDVIALHREGRLVKIPV
jgi:hypothetical protein